MASNGELEAGYYSAEGRAYLKATEMAALMELNERIAKMPRRWYATLRAKD